MLLEKNFNILKSNFPLKDFLEGAYEFKSGKLTICAWGAALDLDMALVDSADTPIELLCALFDTRSQKIRGDLERFVRGTTARVDLGQN
ncbi:MAG TPA: hypothetical protein VHX61_12685 [Rhizomicrobium sp.]|jgi:hypothetical protein|nr:hypothetical protein [Rhizomicrobium sp.]